MELPARTCVLLVAAGAAWEPAAVRALADAPGFLLLRRCMDVTDLLATAESGQAQVAVVSADAPGLDTDAVDRLHAVGLAVVVVARDPDELGGRLAAAGVDRVVAGAKMDALAGELRGLRARGPVEPVADRMADRMADLMADPAGGPDGVADGGVEHPDGELAGRGRVVTVWGPSGAPGRTTVALGVAAELARRGADPLLVDADPWGGAVAQHLGVLEEVSGLLAASRPAADPGERHRRVQRRAAGIRVVTGLPRADRWVEVRDGTVTGLLEAGREEGPVVVDTGFSLEEGGGLSGRRGRNAATLEAVEAADVLLVVGAADPVGLSRLARGLVDLRELVAGRPVWVVVNRMRPTLGWSEREIAGMVEGFCRLDGISFLPEDRPAADRALLTGRSLAETGPSGLADGLGRLVDVLVPGSATPASRRLRRRRGGRARPR